MAEAASAENANIRPPDYRYAVQQIRGAIEKKKEAISAKNGEIADTWAKIESRGVNKKGAKIFAMLDKVEPTERMDILRTVNGCCDAAGWPEQEGDIVDQAEGNVVQMRVGGAAAPDPDVDDDDPPAKTDDDDAAGDEDDDPPAPVARLDGPAAMQAARDRFANGGKKPELTPAYYQNEGAGAHPDAI